MLNIETMRRIRLKGRAFIVFVCCFCLTTILLMTSNIQRPTIHTLVTETQKQLINLKKNFKEEKRMKVDKVYLHFLGLSEDGDKDTVNDLKAADSVRRIQAQVPWTSLANITDPVFVSAVASGGVDMAVSFLKNIYTYRPGSILILFDLGLGESELEELLHFCNGSLAESQLRIKSNLTYGLKRSSSISNSLSSQPGFCFVAPFDPLDLFPSFVRYKAYRPLAIQQVHRYVGCCIIWMELDQRLISGNLHTVLNTTSANGGIATWLRETTIPTTSLTHPKMFEYLVTSSKIEDYNFQHMISLNAIILFATQNVKRDLMLPWVQCSLVSECLEPIGAQSSGCRFDKKPQFRYSGCHDYDVSALNIILGQMFNFDETKYILDTKFFTKAPDEVNEVIVEDVEKNETLVDEDQFPKVK